MNPLNPFAEPARVVAVALNPALDQTIEVAGLQPGAVNRALRMQVDVGGKAVNVASCLSDFGVSAAVTGQLGRDNVALFEELFQRKHIANHCHLLDGLTRINTKVVDTASGDTTDINMPGQVPNEKKIRDLLDQIEFLAETCDWFVLAGNLQAGLSPDFYGQIVTLLKGKSKRVVLDTSGEALGEGLKARPCILKPNVDELSQLTGETLDDLSAVHRAARSLLNTDTKLVVISMGGDGALFVEQDQAFVAQPPVVVVKSTVGAGDAMVAGLVAGLTQNLELTECARLATAFCAAC